MSAHSSKSQEYEIVVFDSYGTLVDVNDLVKTTRHIVAENDPTVFVNLWRSKQLHYTWLRSVMQTPMRDSYKDFWEITQDALTFTLEKLNISLKQSKQDELMNGWLQLGAFPDVRDSLTQIKQNYQIAVLSNGTPRMLREVFKQNKLEDLINSSNEISVDDVRVYKPNPIVYALPEKKLSITKSKFLFVSGNNWDVVGAKSYGLHSVWLNRNNDPKENLGISADYEFSDLNKLAKFLS